MKEKTKSYLKYGLRAVVFLAVLAVFVAFSPLFVTMWHKGIAAGVFAAYTLVLCDKWGIVEWLQVHGNEIVSEMASCGFCLSWWVCVLLCICGWFLTGGCDWVIAPFIGTMVCRILR